MLEEDEISPWISRRGGDSAEIGRDPEYVYSIFPILQERHNQDAATLSGGEQRMCALGRAIMSRPVPLMIDELSLGLAPRAVERLGEALIEINRGDRRARRRPGDPPRLYGNPTRHPLP